MRRNTWIVTAAAALLATTSACAQSGDDSGEKTESSYPKRAVKLIVPFAPGSSTDVVGRVWADCYERQLGKAFTVENRDGGSGSIGMTEAAQAKPDGYTLVFGSTSSSTLTPALNPDVTYDIDSFAPVGAVTLSYPFIVVAKDSPYNTLEDLVTAGQKKTLSVTDSGVSTISGLVGDGLAKNFGLKIKHVTPSSVAEIKRGLEQGDYDFGVSNVTPETVPWIKDKQLKVLAIASEEAPDWAPADTPTVISAGYGKGQLPAAGNLGFIAAPAGTSPAILKRLEKANEACHNDEDAVKLLGEEVVSPEGYDSAKVVSLMRETVKTLEEQGISVS